MREPSPDAIRDVSARLSRPESGPLPYVGLDLTGGESFAAGQQFDIFIRDSRPKPAAWVVCWSDLMMTMFIMFAALYVFQTPKIQFKSVTDTAVRPEGVGELPPPALPVESILGRVHDRVRDLVERSGLEGSVTVRLVSDKALHVTVAGEFLFGPGGAALRPEVKSGLRELAGILAGAPQAMSVVGHAASDEAVGDAAGSWRLAAARAMEVAMFLTAEAGFPKERVLVAAYGDQRPVLGDDGFRRSRRVELVLSAENPTEPLPAVEGRGGEGFRRWVAASARGGL